MLDSTRFQEYLDAGNLVLCHVTTAENVEAILREGIRPGSDVGKATRNDFFKPRAARIYLIAMKDVPVVEVAGEPRVMATDLRKLDPALMDPDEDMVSQHLAQMVDTRPPFRECDGNGTELPGQAGLLAKWADETDGFDRSEVTEASLMKFGRVAYRGVIPACAVTHLDMRSQTLEAFSQHLDDSLRAALPELPAASDWRNEVDRSRRLVERCVEAATEVVGHPAAADASNVFKARSTARALRPVIRELYRDERVPEGDAVRLGQNAIELTEGFTEFHPVSDLLKAQEVAIAAAAAVNKLLESDLPHATMVAVATSAFSAAVPS